MLFRYLVNARGLHLECSRVLHQTMLVPVFMYSSEIMMWMEEERSRIRAVKMNNWALGRWIDPNARIRELYRVRKGADERIDEGVLQFFDHVKRIEIDRIDMRMYVGECAGNRSVGGPRKR